MRKVLCLLVSCFCLISCGNEKSEPETLIEEKTEEVKAPEVMEPIPEPLLVFTVQIGANRKESAVFSAVEGVQVFEENGLFKYRLGAFDSYKKARTFRKNSLYQFPDAFIQAVLGDEPISIQEALK